MGQTFIGYINCDSSKSGFTSLNNMALMLSNKIKILTNFYSYSNLVWNI